MTSITFDTLAAARTLRSAGVDEKTAEAIVAVVQRTTDLPNIEHLATKEQVEGLQRHVNVLQTIILATAGFNLAGFVAIAALIYNLLKH